MSTIYESTTKRPTSPLCRQGNKLHWFRGKAVFFRQMYFSWENCREAIVGLGHTNSPRTRGDLARHISPRYRERSHGYGQVIDGLPTLWPRRQYFCRLDFAVCGTHKMLASCTCMYIVLHVSCIFMCAYVYHVEHIGECLAAKPSCSFRVNSCLHEHLETRDGAERFLRQCTTT